jgi:hypothetical protein
MFPFRPNNVLRKEIVAIPFGPEYRHRKPKKMEEVYRTYRLCTSFFENWLVFVDFYYIVL